MADALLSFFGTFLIGYLYDGFMLQPVVVKSGKGYERVDRHGDCPK